MGLVFILLVVLGIIAVSAIFASLLFVGTYAWAAGIYFAVVILLALAMFWFEYGNPPRPRIARILAFVLVAIALGTLAGRFWGWLWK